VNEPDYNLLIISDLHLSEGFQLVQGSLAPNEDFLSDEGFAEFLRFHDKQREQLDGPWRLIIAGDLVDFLQVISRSAADADALGTRIEALKEGEAILARDVDDPARRRAQAVGWLDEAIARMKAQPEDSHQAVIDCAQDLKAWAPQVEDRMVWDLERLALETWILALKGEAKLSPSESRFGLGTSWPETVWKLDRIAEGHPVFFHALAWFIDQGNSLVLMKGNHDVEFHWPQVQARMRDLLADGHAQLRLTAHWWTAQPLSLAMEGPAFWEAMQTEYSFCPWIYFEPGLLYLEHGNQYEVLDAFPDFLDPILSEVAHLIQVPPGSYFSRYFFNKVEESISFIDNLRPVTRSLAWAFKNRFWSTARLFTRYRGELWYFTRQLVGRGWKDRQRQKERERLGHLTMAQTLAQGPPTAAFLRRMEVERLGPQTMAETLAPGGLTAEHLRQIEALALKERSQPVSRMLQIALITLPILLAVLIGLSLLAIFVLPAVWAWANAESGASLLRNYFLGVILLGLVGFGLRYMLAPAILTMAGLRDYLLEPAGKIWEILTSEGSPEALRVRYLVFGHTHEPNMQKLGEEKDAPWYVNTGSWLYKVGEVETWERLYKDYTFLQILRGEQPESPRLLRWNEATGRPERIRRRLAGSPEEGH
jgi:UDP-2,3-diacylglucosamine pyrophosphatase LpxH